MSSSSKPTCIWVNFFDFNGAVLHVLCLVPCRVRTGPLACRRMLISRLHLLRYTPKIFFRIYLSHRLWLSNMCLVPKGATQEQDGYFSNVSRTNSCWKHSRGWDTVSSSRFCHIFFQCDLLSAEVRRSVREADCFHSENADGWKRWCDWAHTFRRAAWRMGFLYWSRRETG